MDGLTFNSGYAARYRASTSAYCDDLKRQVEQHQLDAHTLYLVRRWNVREMRAAGAICGRLERLTLCVVSPQHRLAQYLAANRP